MSMEQRRRSPEELERLTSGAAEQTAAAIALAEQINTEVEERLRSEVAARQAELAAMDPNSPEGRRAAQSA